MSTEDIETLGRHVEKESKERNVRFLAGCVADLAQKVKKLENHRGVLHVKEIVAGNITINTSMPKPVAAVNASDWKPKKEAVYIKLPEVGQ